MMGLKLIRVSKKGPWRGYFIHPTSLVSGGWNNLQLAICCITLPGACIALHNKVVFVFEIIALGPLDIKQSLDKHEVSDCIYWTWEGWINNANVI